MMSVTVAVQNGDQFNTADLRLFLGWMQSAAGGLTVILPDNLLAEIGSANDSMVFRRLSKGSSGGALISEANCVREALLASPEAKHVVIVASSGSKLPSVSRIREALESGLDYLRISNCIFLSRKYANHVLETGTGPSSINARHAGFRAESLFRGLIRSPKDAVKESILMKFALVGASGVVVNYVVVIVFKIWISWISILIGDAVGVELSIINNFIWNDMYTFKNPDSPISSQPIQKITRLLKYNTVSLISTLVNLSVFYYLESIVGVFYIWSLTIAIMLAFVINYIGSSRWAWSKVLSEKQLPTVH